MRQVLNFDYTKQSPVAFVPVMSCDGVGGAHDSEKGIAVREWMGRRVIPANQKVQVTVSLVVPESEYNTNLGIFQVLMTYLSHFNPENDMNCLHDVLLVLIVMCNVTVLA